MSNWRDIRHSMRKIASKAVSKTGDLTDTASLHVKLARKEAFLTDLYEQFGRVAYKQIKSGNDDGQKVKILVEKIDVVRAEIYAITKAIEDKKMLKEMERTPAQDIEEIIEEAEKAQSEE